MTRANRGLWVFLSRTWQDWRHGLHRLPHGTHGVRSARAIRNLCAQQNLAAPRSPRQNPYVERVIGSIRRECLNHVIILNEDHLRKVLKKYFRYYTGSRTHLALGKDCPEPRMVEPPEMCKIVAIPQFGGLHHRYTRMAA